MDTTIFLVLLCLSVASSFFATHKKYSDNNVCNSAEDYNTIDYNDNCWYNPDADYTVPKIIKSHGYPMETHEVTTQDGFYLKLFRIPFGIYSDNRNMDNKQPVFLQHGIFSSCACWVLVGNRSLAFLLAEKGYDVWLGNSRGSIYSLGHRTWNQNNPKYWNWSFTEQGLYDLPDSLDVVISKNGRSDIIYIGQSLGTNLPYVYSSIEPDEARKKIALSINLGPTLFLGGMRNALRRIAPYEKYIRKVSETLAVYEILPPTTEFKNFFISNCLTSKKGYLACVKLIFDVFGPNYKQFLPETLPLILGHYPAGTSWKNFIHLLQQINSNRFAYFDYGKWKNMEIYNMSHPPSFNLSKTSIPSYIMYAGNDYTATEIGAIKMYEQLPEETRVGLYKIKNKFFNHVDFIFGKDVVQDVYEVMLKVMEKYK